MNKLQSKLELLIQKGFSREEAISIIYDIAYHSYEEGFIYGQDYRPAIVGETLGNGSKDFFEWWEEESRKLK